MTYSVWTDIFVFILLFTWISLVHFASLLQHSRSILSSRSQSSWRRYHDDDTKTDYYYDHATGESRWDLPEGEILVEDGDDDGEEEEVETYDETAEETDDLYVSTRRILFITSYMWPQSPHKSNELYSLIIDIPR